MHNSKQDNYHIFSKTYPNCSRIIPEDIWKNLVDQAESLELFDDILLTRVTELQLPEYLAELAALEYYASILNSNSIPVPKYSDTLAINPTIQLFNNNWKNLSFQIEPETAGPDPERGEEQIIVWQHPVYGRIKAKPVNKEELLVLKMALENLSTREVSQEGNIHVAAIEAALIRALDEGIVTGPEPLIKRHYNPDGYKDIAPSFWGARIFSLQWHITQACDLHCRHCYDRDQYESLSLEQEINILDDLAEFCGSHNIHGQVTFTGGNPLLHPNFEKLYQEAAERGFTTAILGNPTSREQIERLNAIQPLAFYQVSLEGLEEHNDYIRGKDHFKRILAFLDVLREMDVFSMVMLTLTRDNMDQVLPLSEILRTRTDLFTFNRLSLVGEGASLVSVDPEEFPLFLETYAAAADNNPILGLKDNLLNIVYSQQNRPLFGGCTGYGCGAAFNFITVLADGEVHACRKFPSPLGNLKDLSLEEIYHSAAAKRYRGGPAECQDCSIRPVCGGCLAVAYSHGKDIYKEKDPYCFMVGRD